jgi:hypothetical protein
MTELSPVYEGKVTHDGLFDFKGTYQFLYDWFSHYNYIVVEQRYSEKATPEGKELEIKWLCLRKISDYFRFQINLTIRTSRLNPVEVVIDGVKTKKDKGYIELKFGSYLERDYESKWESNPISKFFRGLYDKYIIKTRIEAYEDQLAVEVEEMIAQAKSFLDLEGRR